MEAVEHRTVSIYDLIPHERNYNKHPQEQIERVKASLRRFSQVDDAIVKALPDGKYKIVAHECVTTSALQLLEAGECPHLERWNVTIVPDHWTELDIEGYMAASNETARLSNPDQELLAELLQEQQDAGFDLASLGTDEETLRQMLEALGDEGGKTLRDEDEDDLLGEVETRTKVGDIWQLGRHKVGVFNCMDRETMQTFLGERVVQAVISDPPYGMRLDASFSYSTDNAKKGIKASKGYKDVIGDDKDFDASFLFYRFPHAKEMFLFGADYYVDTLPDCGKSGSWMVWDKKNEATRNVLGLADFELIWTMQRHKRRVYSVLWHGALGTESEDTKRRVHPTQKPVRLLESIIGEYIKLDMLIVDPFLGSGSTLVACENLGHTCYGVEVSPEYASVTLARWEQHTGQTATLLERIKAEETHA